MKVILKESCFYNESGTLENTYLIKVILDNGKRIKKEFKTNEERRIFLGALNG